ncbi:MAG: DUF4342 domain-containing protein [Firmicutes bacterium]|jgi:hypothetical protein|nr:DUF4342 domain-containing protein [Bacillota bacterium]NLL89113.1 DUF4342 domain-containing protein [Bacillota bacterium]
MENRLEQIERLRERARVTYEEAKQAYEAANGDLLEALIILEKQGKVQPPEGDGFYSSERPGLAQEQEQAKADDESFSSKLERFWQFLADLINKGNNTYLEVSRKDSTILKAPLTIMVIVTLWAPWLILFLLIFGLFLKFHYRISENPQNGG